MENLDKIIGKADKLLSTHGEELTDLALYTARIEAISFVVGGLLFLALAGILLYTTYRCIQAGDTDYEIPATICGMLGLLSLAPAILLLGDVMNWIGMFQPEVYLISEILGKAK